LSDFDFVVIADQIPKEKRARPEFIAIRNIISQNPQHSFMLLVEGPKFEHYKEDGVCCARALDLMRAIQALLSWPNNDKGNEMASKQKSSMK
jgi:hypothetical protein